MKRQQVVSKRRNRLDFWFNCLWILHSSTTGRYSMLALGHDDNKLGNRLMPAGNTQIRLLSVEKGVEPYKIDRIRMSSAVNLVVTIVGFAVSAIFLLFILARLFCLRLQERMMRPRWAFTAAMDSLTSERTTRGMDASLVRLLPTIKYNQDVFASSEDARCSVCLGEYEDKEDLRILPQCGHTYHIDCIDVWLRQQATCPVCRVHLQSCPLSTNTSSTLLSIAAISRFNPGALPANFFKSSSNNSQLQCQGVSGHDDDDEEEEEEEGTGPKEYVSVQVHIDAHDEEQTSCTPQ